MRLRLGTSSMFVDNEVSIELGFLGTSEPSGANRIFRTLQQSAIANAPISVEDFVHSGVPT